MSKKRSFNYLTSLSRSSSSATATPSVVKTWRPAHSARLHQHHHSPPSPIVPSPSTFDPAFFNRAPKDASVESSYPVTQPHSANSNCTPYSPSSQSGQTPPPAGVPRLSNAVSSSNSSGPDFVGPSSANSSTSTDVLPLATNSNLFSTRQGSRSIPNFLQGKTFSNSKRSYIFQPGAAGIPKRQPQSTVVQRPNLHRDYQSVQVGEDAYFIRPDALGVADGVGGWTGRKGANPALFARKLMHHSCTELSRYDDVDDDLFLSYYDVEPTEVLQKAYERTLEEAKEEGIVGSSTSLLAVLREDELRVANIGDCCCSVIRGSDYIFRTEEQQHSFNYPFQIGTNSQNTPARDAQRFTVKVQKDDIVILSSDGLVDNLFDDDILEEVLRFARFSSPHQSSSRGPFSLQRFSPQAVAEALANRAKAVSEDQHAVTSPFQQKAMEEGIHYVGGKNDDVSVLVARIGDQEDAPDRR